MQFSLNYRTICTEMFCRCLTLFIRYFSVSHRFPSRSLRQWVSAVMNESLRTGYSSNCEIEMLNKLALHLWAFWPLLQRQGSHQSPPWGTNISRYKKTTLEQAIWTLFLFLFTYLFIVLYICNVKMPHFTSQAGGIAARCNLMFCYCFYLNSFEYLSLTLCTFLSVEKTQYYKNLKDIFSGNE